MPSCLLYDDAAVKIREENRRFLSGETVDLTKSETAVAS